MNNPQREPTRKRNKKNAQKKGQKRQTTGGFAQLGGDAHNFEVRADEAPIAQSRPAR